mgnify:CR=1 FL=1
MLEVSLYALTVLVQIVSGIAGYSLMSITNQEELYCLAVNAYHEARGESFDDKFAVTQVVMNRVESTKYPDDVCGVITEGPLRESWKTRQHSNLETQDRIFYPVKHRCQFSWYCDGKSDIIYNIDGWEDSVIAASLVYTGFGEDIVKGATHYYAHDIVSPSWAERMEVTVKLKGHTYLKEN